MYSMKLKVIAVAMLLFLVPSLVFALAPTPPSIFLLVTPDSQIVAAGDSVEFQVSVLPAGTWQNGEVSFNIESLPEGVTVNFVPETWTYEGDLSVTMIVDVAVNVVQGNMVLKIVASGRECCFEGVGENVESSEEIEVNVSGINEKPSDADQVTPPDIASPSEMNVITVTESVTVTTSTTITSTVTQVITTKSSTISPTITNRSETAQISDALYPITVIAMIVIIFGAVIMLRKQNILSKKPKKHDFLRSR